MMKFISAVSALWAASKSFRHSIAGGIIAAVTAAYATGTDNPAGGISAHQWIGLGLVFLTGAGLTKYTIPVVASPTPPAASPSARK